jgi:hypothetical protein
LVLHPDPAPAVLQLNCWNARYYVVTAWIGWRRLQRRGRRCVCAKVHRTCEVMLSRTAALSTVIRLQWWIGGSARQ